ncbi:MAG: hypothetical protein QXJ72_03390 [Thermoproteota archaeon]
MGEYRNISELWKISRRIYHEIAVQSVFPMRKGEVLPQDIEVKNVFKKPPKNLTIIPKLFLAFYIIFLNFIEIVVTIGLHSEMGVLVSVYYVSNMLCLIMFLFIINGMWEIVNFISSRISEFLITLPLSRKEVSKILLMTFIRMFDVPLVVATITIPITYGILYGSILGAFLVLMSVVTAEVFGISIATLFASYFYFKVLTKGTSVLRIIYTVLWSISFMLTYSIVNLASTVLKYVFTFGRNSPLLTVLYPLSFGFLASYMTSINSWSLFTLASLFSSFAYLILAAISIKWFVKTIGNIGYFRTASGFFRRKMKEICIKPSKPWFGIVKKDLKIILGSPLDISTILLMPLGFTILIGLALYNFSKMGEGFSIEILGMLFSSVILLFTILLPPLLIILEENAYSYVVSLPIRKSTLLFSKVFLSFTYYLIIFAIFTLISIMIPNFPITILLYSGIGNVPAVFSAITFSTRQVIKNLGKAFTSIRLIITEIFLRLFLLSILLAVTPSLIKYLLEIVLSETVGTIGFLISSIVEFAIAIILIIKTKE